MITRDSERSYVNNLQSMARIVPGIFRSSLQTAGLICLVLVLLAISPALAGTQIMAGSPVLGAHIAGTNEFSPGDDVNLQVVIGNTGLNQFMIVQSGKEHTSELQSHHDLVCRLLLE